MNTKHVIAVRNRLAGLYLSGNEHGYNQELWALDYECNTPGCIAGHAVWLQSNGTFNLLDSDLIYDRAREWLGLDAYQAIDLFNSRPAVFRGGPQPTLIHAIDVLHRLATTGKVEWRTNPTITVRKSGAGAFVGFVAAPDSLIEMEIDRIDEQVRFADPV